MALKGHPGGYRLPRVAEQGQAKYPLLGYIYVQLNGCIIHSG